MLCGLAVLFAACSSQPSAPSANERRADAYLQQGIDALQRKAYAEALRALFEANKYNPKSADIWTDLGIAYAGKNEVGKAEESWRKALLIDPRHDDARLNLGILYFQKKRYPEAERILKEASKNIAYHRADIVAFQLAQIYLAQNKPLLAEEQLKLATRDNANNCAAWSQLGNLQKERGDYNEATQSMKGATMGLCYKNPRAHYELATLYLKNHDVPQAKSKLLEIIQLFPTSEWAEKSEATLNMIR
jgi:Tfp pilus assembly protein PilF